LFLQSWYGLSDPMTEELMRNNTILDETTICKFRNALIKNNLLESIFKEVKNITIEKRITFKRYI
jgi:transposase, IS5 family